jgi:hypothetical protein
LSKRINKTWVSDTSASSANGIQMLAAQRR